MTDDDQKPGLCFMMLGSSPECPSLMCTIIQVGHGSTFVIPVPRKLRQEGFHDFKASLGYKMRPCFKMKHKKELHMIE